MIQDCKPLLSVSCLVALPANPIRIICFTQNSNRIGRQGRQASPRRSSAGLCILKSIRNDCALCHCGDPPCILYILLIHQRFNITESKSIVRQTDQSNCLIPSIDYYALTGFIVFLIIPIVLHTYINQVLPFMEAVYPKQPSQIPKNSWPLLLAFSVFAFVTQIGYVHLPSIVNSAATYYNCTPEKIMTFSNIFPLFSCILGWLPLVMLRLRFNSTVFMCSLVCTAGFWTTYMAMNNYDLALTGHFLLSLSSVFSLSPAIYIAQHHFSSDRKALAIAIPYYFMLFGSNFAYVFSTNMIAAFQISHINFVYAVIGSVQLVLCTFSLRNGGGQRRKDEENDTEHPSSFRKEVGVIMRKPQVILTLVVLSVSNGIGSALTTLIAYMFSTPSSSSPKITDQQIGFVALIYNSAGAVVGIIISKLISRKNSQMERQASIRNFFQLLFMASALSSVLFAIYCNYLEVEFITLCAIMFLLGGSLNGSYSVVLQFITHKYGLSELLISNMFSIFLNFISYLVIVYMSMAKQAKLETYILAMAIVACGVYLQLMYFRNGEKNVTHFEPMQLEKGGEANYLIEVPKDSMIDLDDRKQ